MPDEITLYQALHRAKGIVSQANRKIAEAAGKDPRVSEAKLMEDMGHVVDLLDYVASAHANDDFGRERVRF